MQNKSCECVAQAARAKPEHTFCPNQATLGCPNRVACGCPDS
jgi:hypothetical protein